MTIQDFITKAIEGGWKPHDHFNEPCDIGSLKYEQIFLSPLAWKAVGKVEGWGSEHRTFADQAVKMASMHSRGHCTGYCRPTWLKNMHGMIDALAEGKTIERYLETLWPYSISSLS